MSTIRLGPLTQVGLMAIAMTAFLVTMLVRHEHARTNSPEIVMTVEGYDPRDLLLGHYARITTPLRSLDPRQLDGDDAFEIGAPIYVTLTIDENGLARPAALHNTHPGIGLVAAGRIRSAHEVIQAQFNIERYYAGRSEALALEDRLQGEEADEAPVRIILALPASGHLLIKGFEIDGERRIDRVW